MTNGNGLSNIDIHEAGLPARAINALENLDKFKTLGDLDKAKDSDLLKVERLGRKTVEEIRAAIRSRKQASMPVTENVLSNDIDSWVTAHRHIIAAIIAGELVIKMKGGG